ncbi:MAG: glycosyltransferase domain-containing protein [Rhizobiaceae bacterium]
MASILIYKAAEEDYDWDYHPILPRDENSYDCQWITRNPKLSTGRWTRVHVASELNGKDFNRRFKFFTPPSADAVDLSVYMDGNIRLLPHFFQAVEPFLLSGCDFAMFRHPTRNNVLEEIHACEKHRKFEKGEMERALQRHSDYLATGLDFADPIHWCGLIMRRNTNPRLEAMSHWWDEYMQHAKRDQISFPFVAKRHDLKIFDLSEFFAQRDIPEAHLYRRYPHRWPRKYGWFRKRREQAKVRLDEFRLRRSINGYR